MSRGARVAPGGLVYHVLNRSVGKMKMFRRDSDYDAFLGVIGEAHERCPLRVLSLCVMPTHWHFVVWPRADGELTAFFRWMTHTHAMRWRAFRHTLGYGHLYQGRFKSFPVQTDAHLRVVCRYVERNPLTAGLVTRAEQWRWSSLWIRSRGTEAQRSLLSPWPVDIPSDWTARVNAALTDKERLRMQASITRGRRFGDGAWTKWAAARLKIEQTLRPRGRPRQTPDPAQH